MSDGQFSSKPLPSEGSRRVIRTDGSFSAQAGLSPNDSRAFLESRAVRRAVDRLQQQRSPDRESRACDPLPQSVPAAARELGQPLASARLVQEYLIGLLVLRVTGWLAMACAALFLVGTIIMAGTRLPGRNERPFSETLCMGAFSVALGAVGAWFGIFRGRVISEMCWFCPDGMIWKIESRFDWYCWEDIRDVYVVPDADRPALGICLGRNVSWISFRNTPASRAMVEHIENQASRACLPTVLQLVAEGKSVRFGRWRLSRYMLREADTEVAWRDVVNLECDHGEFFLQDRAGGKLTARLDEVPFPSLFGTLAQAAFAYSREHLT